MPKLSYPKLEMFTFCYADYLPIGTSQTIFIPRPSWGLGLWCQSVRPSVCIFVSKAYLVTHGVYYYAHTHILLPQSSRTTRELFW